MDVAAYLKELLGQEQQVFVPGLGIFSVDKSAVWYDETRHQFYPPKNSIAFLANENGDDQLAKYISRQKNISPQAAGYFIEKFVDQLKADANAKNIPVKEAFFAAEKEAEIMDASFNQSNFGLKPISLSILEQPPAAAERKITAEKEALPQKDYVENFYREFSGNLPEEVIKPKKNTGFWVAIVLLLAICCLGIYALYLYYPNIFSGLLPKKQPEITLAKPLAADTLTHTPAAQPEIKKDTTTKAIADTLVTPAKTVAPLPQKVKNDTVKTADADMVAKSPYEIIGASFKTLKGAKTFLSQLQSRGMHHAKILNNTAGKQVLITFGSYQDKTTAHTALEKLRAKDSHTEAYIQHYLK